MMIKKGLIFIFALIFLLGFVSAFDVQTDAVRGTIINDNNLPGVIHFKITSVNESGNYEIYTTERFQISSGEFTILNKQTVEMDVSFLPIDAMKENTGYVKIPYNIRKTGTNYVQKGEVYLKLINFEDAFAIKGDPLTPESQAIVINVYNVEDVSYENVHVKVSGAFFNSFEKDISLSPYEIEKFSIPVNQDQLKKLVFGDYTIKGEITFNDQKEDVNGGVKLLEKSGIDANQYTGGIIVRKLNVERKNEGNIPTISEIQIKKNIISRLFTTFSIEPQRVERDGFLVYYHWQKELQPDESLNVTATTNLLFPFLLIIAIGVIGYLANLYFSTNLNIRKQVQFVKTHGGEFALKVTLRVSAKKFMDNVTLYDSIPAMAHLYEKYGQAPSKAEHGRLTWNIGKLGEGEERFFSYILYSKLKVVGKFELPRATGVYNVNGKIHESISNKVLFIHEPISK
ncbi:hypothetical protein J4477_01660 [Candidatus Pacearchaeota archaeon]|nr:hypothetical protein [Candidatus Pacearchaeota archaeon]